MTKYIPKQCDAKGCPALAYRVVVFSKGEGEEKNMLYFCQHDLDERIFEFAGHPSVEKILDLRPDNLKPKVLG